MHYIYYLQARDSDLYDRFIGHNTNASTLPSDDYADLLRTNVMPIAPPGTRQVHLGNGSITDANEQAIAVAFHKYGKTHGLTDLTKLCALGFEHGYHGNSIPTLSCSDANVNSRNVPTLDWPLAPFPKV